MLPGNPGPQPQLPTHPKWSTVAASRDPCLPFSRPSSLAGLLPGRLKPVQILVMSPPQPYPESLRMSFLVSFPLNSLFQVHLLSLSLGPDVLSERKKIPYPMFFLFQSRTFPFKLAPRGKLNIYPPPWLLSYIPKIVIYTPIPRVSRILEGEPQLHSANCRFYYPLPFCPALTHGIWHTTGGC